MIVTITGYEHKSFKDKDTGREVNYFEIDAMEPEFSHKNSRRSGGINRTFRLSRVHEDDLCLGEFYEVIFDIRQTSQGYSAKARGLRPMTLDEIEELTSEFKESSDSLPF